MAVDEVSGGVAAIIGFLFGFGTTLLGLAIGYALGPDDLVGSARRVLEAEAERSDGGVATLVGKPIYMPQIKQARTPVEQADMPAART